MPSRVVVNCVVERMVNVVPRLVALSAAPAENACRGVADTSSMRIKDRPIGAQTPVKATAVDRRIFAFKALIEVERPPTFVSMIVMVRLGALTLIDEKYQAQIADLLDDCLCLSVEPFRTGCAP